MASDGTERMFGHILGGKAALGDTSLWLLPLDAEVLDRDGKQMFYATPDGLGSVTPVGQVVEMTFDPPH